MKPGNRLKKYASESLPTHEIIELTNAGMPFQVRCNFVLIEDEEEGGGVKKSFDYFYANVTDLETETLLAAGVPQNVIDLIINN